MKHLTSFRLFENVEMQKDIETLADLILSNITEQAIRKVTNAITNDSDHYMAWGMWGEEVANQLAGKGFSRSFMRLVKTKSFHIRFVYQPKNSTTRGQHDDGKIEVYILPDNIEKIRNMISDGKLDEYTIRSIFKACRSTLVHELQHLLDFWVSNNKFIDKNHRTAMLKMYNDKEYDDYYKLSHEINARYTQTVADMGYNTSYIDKYGFTSAPSTFNWENYLTAFKHRFIGWDIIEPEERKRLISRLSQQYQYMNKNKETFSVDISDSVVNLMHELQDTGIEVYMYYKHSRNYILVQQLLAPSEEAEADALNKIVKLAETYRKTIGLTPHKGYMGIKMKTFIPLLKSLGFKGNTKKYGGKRDYSISEFMFREPKRKFKEIK
jgi:hypothetical protein